MNPKGISFNLAATNMAHNGIARLSWSVTNKPNSHGTVVYR